jgi:adenylate cyclase
MKKHLLRLGFEVIVPAGVQLLFAIVALVGLLDGLENNFFDLFLHARPETPQDPGIVIIDVDDNFINAVGTYPISRNITADGLMLMAEMGARHAVFDIEYLNKSPRGVNDEVLSQEIPRVVDEQVGTLQEKTRDLFGALSNGQVTVREAGGFVNDLMQYGDAGKQAIKDEVGRVSLDNDEYLAQAARFFGNTYFTIHNLKETDETVPPELRKLAVERFRLPKVSGSDGQIPSTVDIGPVIDPIIGQSKGLGYTNVPIDTDGIRRRVNLITKYQDAYFGQLAFRPVLDLLGDPAVELDNFGINLKGARLPDGAVKDIHIPFAMDGSLLLDWQHRDFIDSFKHVSFRELLYHDRYWNDLINNIRARDSWQYYLNSTEGPSFLELDHQARLLKQAIMEGREPRSRVDDYRALRDGLLEGLGKFLASRPEDQFVAMVDQALADPKLSKADRDTFEQVKADAPVYFKTTRDLYEKVMKLRTESFKALAGAFCVIGESATGSTDLGANPFQEDYPNVGTHATVVNMVLQDRFLWDTHPLVSSLIGLVAGMAISFFCRNMSAFRAIVIGFAASIGVVGAILLLFVLTGIYIPVFQVAASLILSFVTVTFIKFFLSEKEKAAVRNAFSHYLSSDVIKEIMANPDKLRLGGTQKFMTAMFTDIKGFSTISEKMNPEELVGLLNQYLTAMSDIILDMKGTIDKYEGDAIIAFFGAPLDLEDHAERAALAAIKMKRIEKEINERFQAEGIAPSQLLTRIGINSGDMVVGNMGTTRKMDYTIIGDSVNLAARLEGVNKQYGTWICVAEDTVKLLGDKVVVRQLDRIRVVGKSVPIRIYELVEEPQYLDEETRRVLDLFHEGLELFENRDWAGALEKFNAVVKLRPDDGPCNTRYLKKCKDFMTTPPPANWDGVFTLDMK